MKTIKNNQRTGESGNVLFLILIAVALFAALSYAVTQSTRSGSGDTNSETALISSAQLTQYPAGIRTSVVRMLIGGVAVEELLFNSPSDFGQGDFAASGAAGIAARQRLVFHPQGGNATYQNPPKDVITQATQWYFNGSAQIQNIGITTAVGGSDNSGNDIVAWLPYVSASVCRRLNDEVGISTGTAIPAGELTVANIDQDMRSTNFTGTLTLETDSWLSGGGIILGSTTGSPFIGQPFGCFQNNNINIYYHVLIER